MNVSGVACVDWPEEIENVAIVGKPFGLLGDAEFIVEMFCTLFEFIGEVAMEAKSIDAGYDFVKELLCE